MTLRRCESGHYFDAARYSACPACDIDCLNDVTHPPGNLFSQSDGGDIKRLFAGYKIIKEVGSGSTARVYSARKLDNIVALKVFHAHIDYSQNSLVMRGFFENELKTLGAVLHEGIVSVVDSGIYQDQPYIAMKLMEQGSLSAIIERRECLPVNEVLDILRVLADALDFAHSKHIIHRDIKPSNILLDKNGKPAFTDFGVAKVISPKESATAPLTCNTRAVVGTSDFMAPEVLEEAPHTKKSDLYSLGLVVYYALSGYLPSKAITLFGRCKDRVSGNIIPLNKRNPSVSRAVSDAVMRSLATDPTNRFDTAFDFFTALHAAYNKSQAREGGDPSADHGDVLYDNKKLDYLRYVWVPIVVSIVGLVGAIANKLVRPT